MDVESRDKGQDKRRQCKSDISSKPFLLGGREQWRDVEGNTMRALRAMFPSWAVAVVILALLPAYTYVVNDAVKLY